MRNCTINELANALTNEGYNTEVTTVQKNNVEIPCIRIMFNGYASVIYPQADIDNVNEGIVGTEELVDKWIEAIEKSKLTQPLNIERLSDKDYIKANVRLAVERDFKADYIKEPLADFPGLSKYMIVSMPLEDGNGSVRVQDSIVKSCGADLNELWEWALTNTINATTCDNIAKVLGMPMFEDMPMYVLSTKDKYKGASVMLNTTALDNLAKELGVKELTIIPSSIHEIIAIPNNGDDELEVIANMITQVNDEEVSAEEVLFDKPFIYKAK